MNQDNPEPEIIHSFEDEDDFYYDDPFMMDYMQHELEVEEPIWKYTKNDDIVDKDLTKERIIENIKLIYDPEIPLNIYDVGLIYEVNVNDHLMVDIKMTLTSPSCPSAGTLPPMVQKGAGMIAGVNVVALELVWEPSWTPDLISDEIKKTMGWS